jgi:hypothetical protein
MLQEILTRIINLVMNGNDIILEFARPAAVASLYMIVSLPPISSMIDSALDNNLGCSNAYTRIVIKAILVFTLYYAIDKFFIEPLETKRFSKDISQSQSLPNAPVSNEMK